MTNVAADFHLNRLEFVYIHNSFTDGGSVSSFFRNMQQPRGIAKATISIFLASSACVVYAVTADNRAQANWILAEANKTRSKYTHILIGLEVDNSLSALAKKTPQSFLKEEARLLSSIRGKYIESAVWRNGIGQITIYATAEALSSLMTNPDVQAITLAADRGTIYDPDNNLPQIEREIIENGSAVVNIIPAGTNFNWSIGRDGRSVFNIAPEKMASAAKKKIEFLDSFPASAIIESDISGASAAEEDKTSQNSLTPSMDLEITIEGFYQIKNRGDIIAIRRVDKSSRKVIKDTRPAELDPEVLMEAEKFGSAQASIDLKRLPGYSPSVVTLSEEQQASQRRAIDDAFREIIGKVEPTALDELRPSHGIASISIRLSHSALKNIYQNPDPRIAQIRLNRLAAYPSLIAPSRMILSPVEAGHSTKLGK